MRPAYGRLTLLSTIIKVESVQPCKLFPNTNVIARPHCLQVEFCYWLLLYTVAETSNIIIGGSRFVDSDGLTRKLADSTSHRSIQLFNYFTVRRHKLFNVKYIRPTSTT